MARRWVRCTACQGSGRFHCGTCGQRGTIKSGKETITCPVCSGDGGKQCETCHGAGGHSEE